MADADAIEIIRTGLKRYGLDSLADQVWALKGSGVLSDSPTPDEIGDALKDTKEFKERFPANAERASRNLPELSVTDYIDMEMGYRDVMVGSGLPPEFYDQPQDFRNFIAYNTSAAEVKDRVTQGFQMVKNANPEVVRQMKELYNVDDAGLAAYFLDPTKGADILKKQASSATVAAESKRQAGIQLTSAQSEALVNEGVNADIARGGFSTIASQQELLSTNLQGETAISQEEQISGTLGTNAAAKQRIETRKRQRQASFEGGGGFNVAQTGVMGLGTAG
jgi:hypothetical protein